jgi:hypothetical protein
MHSHRSEIRVYAQLFSKAEQSLFGPLTRVGIVPARTTDGAEENGVGGLAKRECFGRERRTARIERAATDQAFTKLDPVIPAICYRAKNTRAFGDYFRANAVAREERNRQRVHTRLVCVDS